MTTATLRLSSPVSAATAPARESLLVRLYHAVMAARMRAAMHEIAMRRHLMPEDIRNDLGSLPFVRGT